MVLLIVSGTNANARWARWVDHRSGSTNAPGTRPHRRASEGPIVESETRGERAREIVQRGVGVDERGVELFLLLRTALERAFNRRPPHPERILRPFERVVHSHGLLTIVGVSRRRSLGDRRQNGQRADIPERSSTPLTSPWASHNPASPWSAPLERHRRRDHAHDEDPAQRRQAATAATVPREISHSCVSSPTRDRQTGTRATSTDAVVVIASARARTRDASSHRPETDLRTRVLVEIARRPRPRTFAVRASRRGRRPPRASRPRERRRARDARTRSPSTSRAIVRRQPSFIRARIVDSNHP